MASSIHFRILVIFQTKNNRFEGQNMEGIKDMLSPPMSKHGGGIHPPGIYALALDLLILKNYRLHLYKFSTHFACCG